MDEEKEKGRVILSIAKKGANDGLKRISLVKLSQKKLHESPYKRCYRSGSCCDVINFFIPYLL